MANPTGPKKTILIIDDEKGVLNLASTILGRGGYDVITADSGYAGYMLLEKRAQTYEGNPRTDLVIVDWMMQGWDGLRFLTELRTRPYKDLPVILMSGAVTREQLLSAAASKAVAVLLKPLVKDVLVAKVSEIIGPGSSM